MQKFPSETPVSNRQVTEIGDTAAKPTRPIELDSAVLGKISGGSGPYGGWSLQSKPLPSGSVAFGPYGGWS